MKTATLFSLLIFITLSCSRDQATSSTPTSLTDKRQKIIELAQKYHNPALGLRAQKDSKLENLSDEMIQKFDLQLFEQCLQNLTAHNEIFDAKRKVLGCEALHTEKWALAKPASHEAFVKFLEDNKNELTACDSLNKIRQKSFQNAMQPCGQLTELLMEVNNKN